jgi:hypothetical protein
MRMRLLVPLLLLSAVFAVLLAATAVNAQVPVTTYHYDTMRTGWNSQETTLSATNFPSNFGALATFTFDDQIDAQPLVLQVPVGSTTHEIVFIVTESNTVYQVDATAGAILSSRNLGSPVPMPLGCNSNGPNVGILSTPVIDFAQHTLYVMAYVNGSPPTYQLHALELGTLNDLVNPPNGVTVTASHTLTDGTTFSFNATYQRQRPALLKLNGILYAAFGGNCDFAANYSRGWVLGWNASTAGTLTPLAANQLNDTQTTDPGVSPPFFLTSVWMSGYGISSDGTNLYFATGNSDCIYEITTTICPSQSTYDGVTHIQESVVNLAFPGQSQPQIAGIFTPPNVLLHDAQDLDVGSGGVLVFPTGNTTYPFLAASGGKDGAFYLLNPQSMGTPLDTQYNYPCWCGPSFFVGSDGINRIVTSHSLGKADNQFNEGLVRTWQVQMSPSPNLVLEGSAPIASGGDGGFFTTVSSNGTTPGSAIIWAVGRATGNSPNPTAILLYAFSAAANSNETLNQLYVGIAGSWPTTTANANIVPVVSDGKVYVASAYVDSSGVTRGQLNIFGPCPTTGCPGNPISSPVAVLASPHAISGTVLSRSGTTLTLKTRTGKSASVDASQAVANHKVGTPLSEGTPVTAEGSTITGNGALVASVITRAKGTSGGLWPPDR